MEIRQARADELPELQRRWEQMGGGDVNLNVARVWVAVEQGAIVGLLAAQLCWQLQPLAIFPECRNKMTRRRAGLSLYRAVETWLSDRSQNRTGIYWFFAVTRSAAVKRWAGRLGWWRQFKGTVIFLKYL